MTQQARNKAALIRPADMTRDQVTETRRVLQEMNDKATGIVAPAGSSDLVPNCASGHQARLTSRRAAEQRDERAPM